MDPTAAPPASVVPAARTLLWQANRGAATRHLWLVYLAAGGLVLGWYLGGDSVLGYHLIGASAVGAVGVGLRRNEPARRWPWVLIGAGLLLNLLADVVGLGYTTFRSGGPPFPSAADLLSLAAYPCLAAGLLLVGRHGGSDRAAHADTAVITGVTAAAVWYTVVGPADTRTLSLAAVVAFGYPLAALLLLGAAVYALLTGATGSGAARLLVAAVGVQLVADTVYAPQVLDGSYVGGGLPDAGWLAAYLCFGAAALHPSMAHAPGRDQAVVLALSRRRFVLLMLTVLGVVTLAVLVDADTRYHLEVLAVVATALVAWRTYRTLSKVAAAAVTDPVTGLANRNRFVEGVGHELRRLDPSRGEVSVALCDVDQFKVLNDALGHRAGDELLVEIGRRLMTLGGAAELARLGGDEFAMLTSPRTDDMPTMVARLQGCLTAPVELQGIKSHTTMAIGIATTSDPGCDPLDLIRDSETAMYQAKQHGRSAVHHFDDELRAETLERLELEYQVRDGLATGQIFCLYQPEVELRTGRLFGFEALARWTHPTRGVRPPDQFIPLLETLGLSGQLFTTILCNALADQARWAEHLGFHPTIAVNMSPLQVNDANLAQLVVSIASFFNTPLTSLWIELTESAVADPSRLSGTLGELRDLGVSLAIDDFGTGWASLARLGEVEWDLIKIDRTFTAGLGHGGHAERVVAATIAMAAILGVPTLAEGVETADHVARLTDLGCDYAQGFHYSAPLPPAEAERAVSSDGLWLGPPGGDLAIGRERATGVTPPEDANTRLRHAGGCGTKTAG